MIVWDSITFLNLILCIAIVVLGYTGYQRKGSTIALYIGIAFGLFGISHLVFLLGYRDVLEIILMWIRTLAYFIVAVAVMKIFMD